VVKLWVTKNKGAQARSQGGLDACISLTLRTVPLNRLRYFCEGYIYGIKTNPSKGHRNPKRKMWVTTHFSEIDK